MYFKVKPLILQEYKVHFLKLYSNYSKVAFHFNNTQSAVILLFKYTL